MLPTPPTHCENVLAELQAKAPGVQGPLRRVAEADAEAEVEVVMVVVVLKTGETINDVDKVVEDELSHDVVFEEDGSSHERVEEELSEDVVLEKVGGREESVGDTTTVVGAVTAAMTAEEKGVER